MAPGISYDDSGSLASYFGVTFLAICLIPATYIVFRPPPKDNRSPICPCEACRAARQRVADLHAGQRRKRILRRILPLVAAWAVFGYLCYALAKAPSAEGETIYNPFEILGISDRSSDKQIKKHYKKLSLQFHPDKIKLAENQTMEDAEGKFVELTKAYKALTDEVTRENLAKYGNPDGPQQREDKIAIPSWVVEGKNSIAVLAAYGLVLGGAIPFLVGRWWFSQRRLTRDGILNPTAEFFFHNLKDDTDFSTIITILASALEFVPILSGRRKGGKKERKERQAKVEDLEKEVEARRVEWELEDSAVMRKESRVGATSAAARRARALLWTHLLRMDLDDAEMRQELLAMLEVIPTILSALVNIALARNWLATSSLAIQLQPAFVQALPAGVSPLAQFPQISPPEGLEMQIKSGAEGKKWLEKWQKSDKEISADTEVVVKSWPRLEVVDVELKVPGEKVVTPSSIVRLQWRCRYVYPSTASSSSTAQRKPNGHLHLNGDSKDEEKDSVAAVEDVVEKVNGEAEESELNGDIKEKVTDVKEAIAEEVEKTLNAEKKAAAGQKGKPATPVVYKPNGYAHAPRWPQLRKPHYYVLLGDSKLDKVIVPPVRITDIPLPSTSDESSGEGPQYREFHLQFQAPPQPNLYSFVAHWKSDTYLGADVHVPVMLRVEELTDDMSEEDDISDPEEDTLAGQMALMKGGKVKPSAVHDGDDDDDDEEGSVYTSSDDEDLGPRRGKAINEDSDSDSD